MGRRSSRLHFSYSSIYSVSRWIGCPARRPGRAFGDGRARRHRLSQRSSELQFTGVACRIRCLGRCLLRRGWAIRIFFGFARGIQRRIVVCGDGALPAACCCRAFRQHKCLFDARFGCRFGVWLAVAAGQRGAILGHRLVAYRFDCAGSSGSRAMSYIRPM